MGAFSIKQTTSKDDKKIEHFYDWVNYFIVKKIVRNVSYLM